MTNTDKTILTDVDGVLLNWDGMFNDWMSEQGFRKIPGCKSYSIAERFGITEQMAVMLVKLFNNSSAIGFCGVERDAAHYVKRLAERGYRFVAITAMGGDRYSKALRKMNLERVFGEVFTDFHFVDLDSPKDDVLKLYQGTECWWIEDKLENAEAGLKYGLRPILMEHSHNEHYQSDEIICVKNWMEVYRTIVGEEYVQ